MNGRFLQEPQKIIKYVEGQNKIRWQNVEEEVWQQQSSKVVFFAVVLKYFRTPPTRMELQHD